MLRSIAGTAAAIREAARHRWPLAVRTSLGVVLPLVIGAAAGNVMAGAQASFGGLAGFYVAEAPYRYRARVVGVVGGTLTVATFVGSVTGALTWWAAAVVLAAVAGLCSFVCQACGLGPPREYLIVMALLAASAVPTDPADALWRAALSAGGAALAWLVTMAPALGDRHGPETRLVTEALTAVADFLADIGSPDGTAAQHRAVTAVRAAGRAVHQAGGAATRLADVSAATERLLEVALHAAVDRNEPIPPVLVTAVRDLTPVIPSGVTARNGQGTMGDPAGDPVALAVAELTAASRGAPIPPAGGESSWATPWPGLGAQLRAAAGRDSVIAPAAARIGVAVGAGTGLGSLLGFAHAFWIGLTACAVLQGSNLLVTRRRLVHRILGTVAGVVLAFAVLDLSPPLPVLIGVIAVAQVFVDLVIAVNYGLAVTGITVLALLLFDIVAPTDNVASVVGERLLDTIIGAVLALLLRLLLWPRATSVRLPRVQARTIRRIGLLLQSAWDEGVDGATLRRHREQLQTDLLDLRALQDDAQADAVRPTSAGDRGWAITAAVDDLAGYALPISIAPTPVVPPADQTASFLAGLDTIARALDADSTPAFGQRLSGLADYPRTSVTALVLAVAVADRGRP